MHAEHNFGPENGLHGSQRCLTGTRDQKEISESNLQERDAVSGFHINTPQKGIPEPDVHVCAINRNSRACCQAWAAGSLPAALRCFAEHHDWHEPGRISNRLKVWLTFKKPVHKAADNLLVDRRDGLSDRIRNQFKRLLELCRPLDDLCGRMIDDVDELGAMEHTKALLAERMCDLAAKNRNGWT